MTVPVAGRGYQVLAIYGLFTALTTITVALRTFCRVYIVRSIGWDDGLAITAWIFFVIFAAFAIGGVHHGTGQHFSNINPPSEIPVALKFWWLCEPIYVISNMAIKASICLQLLRIATKPIKPAIRVTVYIVLIVTEVFSTAFFFVFIFQCQPSEYFWTRFTGGTGSCIDPRITVNVVYAYSAITCVGDWTLAILPCILVWDLQMRRSQKVLVAIILAIGAVASAATIARIPYIHTLLDQDDFLYATTDVALWSCTETGLGITAACCATLRPLIRFCTNSTSTSNSKGQGHSHTALSDGRAKEGTSVKQPNWNVETHIGRGSEDDDEPTEDMHLGELHNRGIVVQRDVRASEDSAVPSDLVRGEKSHTKEFPSMW